MSRLVKCCRSALVICMLWTYTISSWAQGSEPTKVYLKDGSIMIGHILEDNDYFVRLALPAVDTLEIGYKLIASIGQAPSNQKLIRVKKPIVTPREGIFINLNSKLNTGIRGSNNSLSPEIIIGHRLNKGKYNIGMVAEFKFFEFFTNFTSAENKFISTSLYGRLYWDYKKQRKWFGDGKIGYAWPTTTVERFQYRHVYDGGLNGSLALGYHIPSRRRLSTILKVGVDYQKANGLIHTQFNGDIMTSYRQQYINGYLGLGIEF